jgi:hypothetical protein
MHTDTLPARDAGLHTKLVLVTPEIATSWLTHNIVNRPMNPRSVESLAWDIRRGKWTLTHQGIAFNTDGLLVDGQHRLRAIITANQSISLLVTFNVECSFEAPIDTGVMRKVHHVLGMSHRTVAVCNALSLLESGSVVRSTSTRVGEIHARHERGVTWAVTSFPVQRGMTANVLAAHAFAFPVAPDLVEAFAAKFISGANIEPTSPVLLLRRYLDRIEGFTTKVRAELGLITLRALQAHAEKDPMAKIYPNDLGLLYFARRRAELELS